MLLPGETCQSIRQESAEAVVQLFEGPIVHRKY